MAYIEQKVNELDTIGKHIFDSLYEILIDLINRGYTIKQIEETSERFTAYFIINILLSYGENNPLVLNAINNYYFNLRINEQKCLVIADTHIGRLLDNEEKEDYANPKYLYNNEKGLYNAYNYAIKNNIHHVIHLGDLIEGEPTKYMAKRIKPHEQVEYFKRIYPKDNSIKTYLLYGNHDYNAILYDGISDTFTKGYPNMELIGINHSFIYFNGCPIKLCHPSSHSKYLKNITIPYDFKLAGHSHIFNVDEYERIVKAPSLSSSSLECTLRGFLELTCEDDDYIFTCLDEEGNYRTESTLTRQKIFK